MRLRPPVPDDAPAVLAVLRARDEADIGVPDYTLGDLEDEWRSSEVDLAVDAVVAEDADGHIVGYAIVRRPGAVAIVDPEREGEGIGRRLLDWAEARERALGHPRHRQWIAASNARGRALLEAAGYRFERSYWRMTRRLETVPEPVVPPGIRLRALDVEADAAPLHALSEAAFGANADYEPETFEAFCEEHLRAHNVDPSLSLVAEDGDGAMAGFLLARRWDEEGAGFVDLLGVGPGHRGRGLATALLSSAFAAFAEAGLRETQLGVASDNPSALRLYERAGMTTKFRFDTFQRPVDPTR